jgi:radical SAM protein with 4Fe4S-binding SPASM domain
MSPDSPTPQDDPRAINDVLALLDSTWLMEQTAARPTHYDIAVSKVCNIKCPFCPRQTFPADVIQSGLMLEKHYAPVVPHLEAAQRTGLYGLGEPFLNKNFFDFLAAAKEQGTYVMTSTHGMSLTSEMIDRVLDSGLDELCVSMDGAKARTFNFLRNGADFEVVVKNVSELLRRRNERGHDKPFVYIACAISKYNVWQMKAMVRLAKKLGADRIAFSNLVLDHPEHEHASIAGTKVFDWNLNRAKKEAAKIGIECLYFFQIPFPWKEQQNRETRPGMRYGCPSAWRQLIVERDGNLKPCCYLDTSLGNTTQGPVDEQFNSEEALKLRNTFIDGNYHDKCRGCGQFLEISDADTDRILNEAKEMIASGNFSSEIKEVLTNKHTDFVTRWEQMQSKALATDNASS